MILRKIKSFIGTQLLLNKKRKQIKNNGRKLLRFLNNTFVNENIDYFIDFGTLLGFLRDGDFIKYDLDVDLGVILTDETLQQRVKDILIKKGCKLTTEFLLNKTVVEQSFIKFGVKFDIGYYFQGETSSYCYLFYRDSSIDLPPLKLNVVKMKYSKITTFESRKFLDIDVKIPTNHVLLIEEKYGPNWRTPDKNWIYWQAPSAIKQNEIGEAIVYN